MTLEVFHKNENSGLNVGAGGIPSIPVKMEILAHLLLVNLLLDLVHRLYYLSVLCIQILEF